MHERVTGLRDTSHLYLAGVDKTQSIALDEIFGKKQVDQQTGTERTTKTFRKSRVTGKEGTIKEGTMKDGSMRQLTGKEIADELEYKLTEKEVFQEDEDGELVVVQTKVTRGAGLCQGATAVNLVLMIIMWVCTALNY